MSVAELELKPQPLFQRANCLGKALKNVTRFHATSKIHLIAECSVAVVLSGSEGSAFSDKETKQILRHDVPQNDIVAPSPLQFGMRAIVA